MKRIISLIACFILSVLVLTGCGSVEDNSKSFTVIDQIELDEGITADFDYSVDENKITISFSEKINGETMSYLVYVTDDGAIKSMYQRIGSEQSTFFKYDDIEVSLTDSGYIENMVYDNYIEIGLEYNNFDDNELISVFYSDWNDHSGWDKWESDFPTTGIKYTETEKECYKMFNSALWFYSMFDLLEAVYD